MHNFEFLRGGGRFSPLGWLAPLLFSHSFYILGNPRSLFYKIVLPLQDFTVLPTEKFRRCVIRSSSVIPHSVGISVGKTKKIFTDGFTDGTCAPKKKRFPLETYRWIFIPSVI